MWLTKPEVVHVAMLCLGKRKVEEKANKPVQLKNVSSSDWQFFYLSLEPDNRNGLLLHNRLA